MAEKINSPRINKLLHHLRARKQILTNEQKLLSDLMEEVYQKNTDKPEILRKAEFLTAFSDKLPVSCSESELIIGSMGFWFSNAWERKDFYGNMGHIIVDYGSVLKKGIIGINEEIDRIQVKDERININKQAFSQTTAAFSNYIKRYAEKALQLYEQTTDPAARHELLQVHNNCKWIAEKPPRTFWEALQLIWFIQIFLHAEGMSAAISFGRFDLYMYPFYSHDLDTGILSREQAKELLKCFWLKTCEGDESQNLTLGGDCENELSVLCLEVTRELKVWQPSVSVRINENTSEAFWNETLKLIKAGTGMPAIFNDSIIPKALSRLGISDEDARNYGIVGCYEANPHGMALGLTVAGNFRLYEVLLSFLYANKQGFAAYEELYHKFREFLITEYTENILVNYRKTWEFIVHYTPSPFESICLAGCLESGLAAEEGGGKYTMFGINILGLGTTVDSLYVIKRLVYDEKKIGYTELINELENNFPNRTLMQSCKNMSGKYGTDDSFTNNLAHELAETTARLVTQNRFSEKVITYPGLFLFTADIYSGDIPATPDGRCLGDRVSYGIGASDFCQGKTPTSILNSASNAANDWCACGNPLMLSFCEKDMKAEKGDVILRSLIKSYFQKGGFHLMFNIISADILEQAKRHPENYSDLLVRISGFSAKFITLDSELQDALIERTRKGV